MRLLQRVGGVLPGRKSVPEERDAQTSGSAWAAFAQAEAASRPIPEPAEPLPPPEEPVPDEPAPEPVAEAVREPDGPEIPDLMALLPPELRQRPGERAAPPSMAAAAAAEPGPAGLLPDAEPASAPVAAAWSPSPEAQPLPAPGLPAEEDPEGAPARADDPPAVPSGLAALLADGFAQLDRTRAASPPPAASVLPDFLASGLRRTAPGLPPEEHGPAPSGLAAFLADGFRHLEAAPAAPARPEPPAPVAAPEAEPEPGSAPAPTPAPAPSLPVNPSLAAAAEIAGLVGVALVDGGTGLLLASQGRGLDLDALAAVGTQVIRAEQGAIHALGLEDRVEDILVTMGRQIHVIRPLRGTSAAFLYLALDRRAANLGMARLQLERIEARLSA